MLSTLLSNHLRALPVLGLLLVGFGLAQPPVFAQHLSNLLDTDQDWRPDLVGRWECQGVSTLGGSGEEPYAGRLNNQWVRDHAWLKLQFVEQHPRGKPVQEQQLWQAASADGTHRRTIVTNDGTRGMVTSPGPQGNVMRWEGTFGDMALSETLTLLSADEHRWYGELTQGEQQIGYYRLMCTRVSSRL